MFHHHSSIQDEGWSKVGFSQLCSNPRLVYYSCVITNNVCNNDDDIE